MMRLLLLVGIIALLCSVHAQTPPVSASPALEQRVADLEAYINNSPRGADTKSGTASNIAGPGPSYNAWMMTCAALVLFMTLPGLALFYGGLVRAKSPFSTGAMPGHRRAGHDRLVGGRIFTRIFARLSIYRWISPRRVSIPTFR
jgi:hypothetical protein